MLNQQIKYTLWGITLSLFFLIVLECMIYYDPMPFYSFILAQVFKIGFIIRLFFIALLFMICILPENSLKDEHEQKKQKKTFRVPDEYYPYMIGVLGIGAFFLLRADLFPGPSIFELLGLVLLVPSVPVVAQKLKPEPKRYKVEPETKRIDNEHSFSIECVNNSWINIPSPSKGLAIIASNGSGKTASFVEPLIAQAAYKNYTGVIVDYKFPKLTSHTFRHYSRRECKVDFYTINFMDLSRSHRLNPIRPDLLKHKPFSSEFATAFYCSLNRDAIRKQEFWDSSAIAILSAVIWYMKVHYPKYCTLPHVLNLVLGMNAESIINMLSKNYETRTLIASVMTGIQGKAGGQWAGQFGTLQNWISIVNTKEVAWVLSGDDFSLNLNDPKDPKVLCIGVDEKIIKAISPVISFILTAVIKEINSPDKEHSIFLVDEAAQFFIPNISNLPATARENLVATIISTQTVSQMEDIYGKSETETLMSNLNTQIYGRTPNPATGEYVAKLFGKEEILKRNENQNRSNPNGMGAKEGSHSQGVSISLMDKSIFEANDINKFEPGEVAGLAVDTERPYFHTRAVLKPFTFPEVTPKVIPSFYANIDIDDNFERIRVECQKILSGQIEPEHKELILAI